jgi:hypothetical protein
LWNRFPFYLAETLNNHPISDGLITLYERDIFLKANSLKLINKQLTKISSECQWSKETTDILFYYTVFFLDIPDLFKLNTIANCLKECKAKINKLRLIYFAMLYQYNPIENNTVAKQLMKLIRTESRQ